MCVCVCERERERQRQNNIDTQLSISVQFSIRDYTHAFSIKPPCVFNITKISCLILLGSVNTVKRHVYETDFDHMVEVNFHFKRSCYIASEKASLQLGFFLNVVVD